MSNSVLDKLFGEISNNPSVSTYQKEAFSKTFDFLKKSNVNVLLVGGTGSGKSSTINALFNKKVAGDGYIDPVTKTIECYKLDNLILWDTPGLGDGLEDTSHKEKIATKLREKTSNGELLIDMVLVIIDGSTRDLSSAYDVILNTIIPNLGDDTSRLLIAVNQSDMVGKNKPPYVWDNKNNCPSRDLEKMLKEKVNSVKRRIEETSKVSITEPVYYAACVGDEQRPYNLSNLFLHIMKAVKPSKRVILAANTNQNRINWESHTNPSIRDEIHKEIKKSIIDTCVEKGSDIGGSIGKSIAGPVGEVAGKVVGGIVGAAVGAVASAVNSIFSWF